MAEVKAVTSINEVLNNVSPDSINIIVKRPSDSFMFRQSPQKLFFTEINQTAVGILSIKDAADASSFLQHWAMDADNVFSAMRLFVHPNWTSLDPDELHGRVAVAFQAINKQANVSVYYEGHALPMSPWRFIAETQLAYVGLTMQRGNQINPDTFVQWSMQLFQDVPNVRLRVLNYSECIALGMNAFAAMGRGSTVPPRILTVEYVSNPNAPRVALVGKGVTFDTGGINLKTSDINTMYTDKAGAAAVVCAVFGLARRRAPVNVVAVAGLIENAIGPTSVRPDDILTTMSGKTIEVVDTDAEGRVILADILWYAGVTFQPSIIIDMATLTGNMANTFHSYRVPVFGNRMDAIQQLFSVGESIGEKIWPMPLIDEIDVSSLFATVKNISKTPGDGLFAARFLYEFIPPSVKTWIHVDFGGICINEDDHIVNPFGPNLLMSFVLSLGQ